ncbi:MAG: hypothetical protein GTN97_03355 [Nitrosopumilaceae archaeon]|nr:hypothetical protein [Nitrosopumilaceae archaeon]
MSFEGFDIGEAEFNRRQKRSAIPSFTGDIDLEKLSKGVPFPSSADFGKQVTQRNLLAQRVRLEQTPLRVEAERGITDAFLADPLVAPTIDPTRKSNGKRKKMRNKRDRGRASLLRERERLARGGAPRNQRQADDFSELDDSFRSLGL